MWYLMYFIANVLPVVHTLTGCNTTSKANTKKVVLRAVYYDKSKSLVLFGK